MNHGKRFNRCDAIQHPAHLLHQRDLAASALLGSLLVKVVAPETLKNLYEKRVELFWIALDFLNARRSLRLGPSLLPSLHSS